MHPIFDQVAKVAAPVLVAYHDDLNVSDRATFAKSRAGDVLIWALRPTGTHVAFIPCKPCGNVLAQIHHAQKQREYVEAIRDVDRSARYFRIICAGNGLGTVKEITFEQASAVTKDAISRAISRRVPALAAS